MLRPLSYQNYYKLVLFIPPPSNNIRFQAFHEHLVEHHIQTNKSMLTGTKKRDTINESDGKSACGHSSTENTSHSTFIIDTFNTLPT